MHTFVAGGKTVTVLPASVPDAPVVYLNTFGDEGQNVFGVLASGGCPPLSLVAISGLDWNRDMAPWDCPAVFKNAGAFSGGTPAMLLEEDEIRTADDEELEKISGRHGLK